MDVFHKEVKERARSALRWSEKYTKTDMVYLASGGFWLSAGQAASFFFSFLLSIAFANLLSKEVFGDYRYILSLAGALSALTLTGMNAAVTQAVAKGHEGILRASIPLQLKWSILFTFFAVGLAVYYFISGAPVFAYAMVIIGVLYPILSTYNTFVAFLNGKKNFKKIGIYSACIAIASAGSVLVAIFLRANLLTLIFCYYFSMAAINIYLYKKVLRDERPNSESDQAAISYGKHLSFASFLTTVSQQIESIIVYLYLGGGAVAAYYFIAVLPDHFRQAFRSINTLALPKFAQRDFYDIRKMALKKMGTVLLVTIFIAIIYAIFAPFIFHIFFPGYSDLVGLTRVYGFSVILVAAMIPMSIFVAKGFIKESYVLSAGTSFFKILFSLLGVYFGGLPGLVWALLIYALFYVAFSFLLLILKK
jgi:O-antigen/teichoic acid export membrane protein